MVPLIETLRCQHEELEKLAKRVDVALAAGRSKQIRNELDAFEVALMAHLELEDRRLYPTLSHAAAATQFRVPIQIVDTYQRNMTAVSVALRSFFDVHAGEVTDIGAVRRDWAMVSQLLTQRIENEESTLYPLYRSLVDRDG